MLAAALLAFGTLFPIINPISSMFYFNLLTEGFSEERRLRAAFVTCLTAGTAIVSFLFLGQYLLSLFSVELYAFRVAGGLYLGKVAFTMLGKDFYKSTKVPNVVDANVAVMPLGFPLTAGPGTLTAVLALAEGNSFMQALSILFAATVILIMAFFLFYHGRSFGRFAGESFARVFERIMGLIVLVIATQFVFHGISGYLASLG